MATEFIENAVGRMIPVEINGKQVDPFIGVGKHKPTGKKFAPAIGRLKDLKGMGDFGLYITHLTNQQAPYTLMTLGGAGVVCLGGVGRDSENEKRKKCDRALHWGASPIEFSCSGIDGATATVIGIFSGL